MTLRRSAPRRVGAGAIALGIAVLASSVWAGGDPARGRILARQWCASCHQIEPGAAASDTAPAFASVANDPAMTPARLRAWLADPHPPMPNPSLSREEIDAIVAYLESLRED